RAARLAWLRAPLARERRDAVRAGRAGGRAQYDRGADRHDPVGGSGRRASTRAAAPRGARRHAAAIRATPGAAILSGAGRLLLRPALRELLRATLRELLRGAARLHLSRSLRRAGISLARKPVRLT